MQDSPAHSDMFALLGEATTLMAESALHRSRTIAEIRGLVFPPVQFGQFRIWRRGAAPVGLATWAWLDAPTEARVLHEGHLPEDAEWNSGPNPVVIDFITPFGDGFAIARDLKRTVFPDRALRSVRRDAAGNALRIVQHPGRDAAGRHLKAAAYAA